ncbi:MAG TPA: hypothetical protein VF815_29950 [Myxococcaceae bacterium]|jgi:hypothetical protein
MSPTDNDEDVPELPPPSEEEKRLLQTVANLPPEKKRRLMERLLQVEIIPRSPMKPPEGGEAE